MKNYKNSDYALNRYSEGIVYRFADETITVTLEDYLAENPDKTPDDFLALKMLSDDIYHNQDRGENAKNKRNIPLYELDRTALRHTPSPEEMFIDDIDAIEEAEKKQQEIKIAKSIMDKLTEVQRRRYLSHIVDRRSTWEIAEIEGANQKSVYESLSAAEKKIKKFFKNN